MKKQVLSLFLSGALALSLFGCAAQPAEESAPQSSPAETAGSSSAGVVEELKIGTLTAPEVFNMSNDDSAFGRMNYTSFCAAPLLEFDANNMAQPYLMTSWEVSEDNCEIIATFAVDQGITWHDGELLTMDDIIFSLDYLPNVAGHSHMQAIDEVEQLDETTLRIHFDSPSAFLFLNNCMSVWPIPKHIWEGLEDPEAYAEPDAAVGCGPYRFVRFDEEAQTMYYEAVGESYMGRPLTVQSVTVRTYDSSDALIMALRSGEVDAMYNYSTSISATQLDSITGVEGLDPGMSDKPGCYQLVFGFQAQPTDDLAFRQAVSKALDYELLAVSIGGKDAQVPGAGFIPPSNLGYDAELPRLAQDVEAARTILDEAGYADTDGDGWRELPGGSAMEVLLTPQVTKTTQSLYLRMAEIIQSNLADVGVKVILDEESVRNSDHQTEVRRSLKYELYLGATSAGVAQYRTGFYYMIDTPEFPGWGSCNIPEYSEAYRAVFFSSNYDEYLENIKNMQELNAEQLFGIALCWEKCYFPYRTDRYEGWNNYPGRGVINNSTWYNLRPVA